jgi:hypothetical protein
MNGEIIIKVITITKDKFDPSIVTSKAAAFCRDLINNGYSRVPAHNKTDRTFGYPIGTTACFFGKLGASNRWKNHKKSLSKEVKNGKENL